MTSNDERLECRRSNETGVVSIKSLSAKAWIQYRGCHFCRIQWPIHIHTHLYNEVCICIVVFGAIMTDPFAHDCYVHHTSVKPLSIQILHRVCEHRHYCKNNSLPGKRDATNLGEMPRDVNRRTFSLFLNFWPGTPFTTLTAFSSPSGFAVAFFASFASTFSTGTFAAFPLAICLFFCGCKTSTSFPERSSSGNIGTASAVSSSLVLPNFLFPLLLFILFSPPPRKYYYQLQRETKCNIEGPSCMILDS